MNQMTTNTRVALLDSTTTNEVGDGIYRGNYEKHFIQSVSEAAVVVTISISGDGVNWIALEDNTLTGNDYLILDGFFPYVRASRDASVDEVVVTIYSSRFEA